MGLFRMAQKTDGGSVAMENPQKKIIDEMTGEGRIFALFSREGEFLVDHFGKTSIDKIDFLAQSFYLAMNLNFIQDFGNTVKLGLCNTTGTELLSPDWASLKLAYHLPDDVIVHTNSKDRGSKINLKDYEGGIMLVLLKMPRQWTMPAEGQLRLKLQASLTFNPLELETFLLKLNIKEH